MLPSHTPVIVQAPKSLAGKAGHVVACDDKADPPTVDVKLDETGDIVTVAADKLQVLG